MKRGRASKNLDRTDPEKPILIAWIGECEDNPVPWFRELVSVDGTRYRIYHRRGRMYCTDLDTGEILFDRDEGDSDAMAGSDEEILEQTSDFFGKLTRGEVCPVCRAVYPQDCVPHTCFNCETTLRAPHVVSLLPLESKKLPFSIEFLESSLMPGKRDNDLDAGEISDALEKGPISGGWALCDEFGAEYQVVVTANIVAGFRLVQNGTGEKLARYIKGYRLLDKEIGTVEDYMLELLVIEDSEMQLGLDLLKCRTCNKFKRSADAGCANCGNDGNAG